METMTSVVMIGRRTKGSVRLISPGGNIFGDFRLLIFHNVDFGARRKAELTARDDEFAGDQAFRDNGVITDSASDLHPPHFGGVAGDDKDLGSLLAFHARGCRHSQGVWFLGELDGYIDELAGPKTVIL